MDPLKQEWEGVSTCGINGLGYGDEVGAFLVRRIEPGDPILKRTILIDGLVLRPGPAEYRGCYYCSDKCSDESKGDFGALPHGAILAGSLTLINYGL